MGKKEQLKKEFRDLEEDAYLKFIYNTNKTVDFIGEFKNYSDNELVLLWSMCLVDPTVESSDEPVFDDEVYEAIYERPNARELFDKANRKLVYEEVKKFSQKNDHSFDKYEEIKDLLEKNNITSKDLNMYLAEKKIRYERYKDENGFRDEEIKYIVGNNNIDVSINIVSDYWKTRKYKD